MFIEINNFIEMNYCYFIMFLTGAERTRGRLNFYSAITFRV